MADPQPDKGGRAEELLREYFLSAGFFAVRGVPVTYSGFDITDVDLWLYLRSSPIGRERANVDAKNKQTPKALERVLWAKGLQAVLRLERCIVATTDKRAEVKEYGVQHDVLVLDGAFLARLANRKNGAPPDRLSEEELTASLGSGKDDKLLGNWRGKLMVARGRLLSHLEFDGCNAWLEDVRYFVEQAATSGRYEQACRLAYMITAYFLIGLDFSLRTLAFEEAEVRKAALEEGFRYGSRGQSRTEDSLNMATQMVTAYAPDAKAVGNKMRTELLKQLQEMPVNILSEFFSRTEIAKDLFGVARGFESRAYARNFISPGNLEASLQAVLGVLLDFNGIDRRKFLK